MPMLWRAQVAMTGHVDADAVLEFRELGFAGLLGKPFSLDGLAQALQARPGEPFFSLTTS